MKHRFLFALLAWLALPATVLAAQLELPRLFSDGAVLQRDRPLPVWGRAAPGAKVEVEFDGHRAQATADADGRWSVELPAQAAGGPHALVVRAGGERMRIADLLVGEVWLASGQSNMEWPVASTQHAQEDIAAPADPWLRQFKVPRSWAEALRSDLEGGQWKSAAPDTVGEFSAVAHAFARELRQVLQVPVGVIDSTWGGSSIEAWMDAAMLGLDAAALETKMRERRAADLERERQVHAKLAAWPELDPASEAFAAVALDEGGWAPMEVPATWESRGYPGMDGTAWYRTRFELREREAQAGVVLGLGKIDDIDTTWVNGVRVGATSGHTVPRVYAVPASALRPGLNTVAVRVVDNGGGGGFTGGADGIFVEPLGGQRRSLAGEWRFRSAAVTVSSAGDKNRIETLLYNAMIHPLQPYPLAGVIWYQGEANASEQGAYRYRELFTTLIEGWRGKWGAPELPFLWAQLAAFDSGDDRLDARGVVVDSPWATLRESQSAALALPRTAQAVTIDVGAADDIHPRDKRTVGHRLALAARRLHGEEGHPYSGPVFRAAEVKGREMVLRFDAWQGVLAARDGGSAPRGFELAGADGRFHPAQARIAGDTVILRSDAVRRPELARYAWSDNPSQADLVGADGLPASPFRTREW